jgi:hypothetical protein
MTKIDTLAMLRRVTADLQVERDPDRLRGLRILKAKLESHHRLLARCARLAAVQRKIGERSGS